MDESGISRSGGNPPSGPSRPEEVRHDEIDLFDYMLILWHYKYTILAGTIVLAGVAWAVLLFTPSCHRVTFAYPNWNLDGRGYEILLNHFYSSPNLEAVWEDMLESELPAGARAVDALRRAVGASQTDFVRFSLRPAQIDLSGIDPEKLDRTMEISSGPPLLCMSVMLASREELSAVAAVVRKNVEKTILLGSLEQKLISDIINNRSSMAAIEGERFGLELALQTRHAVLAKLQAIIPAALDSGGSEAVLQFNINEQGEYLPLPYHIQAAETAIVEREEKIQESERRYEYLRNLLHFNELVLNALREHMAPDMTAEDFLAFLRNLPSSERQEMNDYLAAYIKRIENDLAARIPVTASPPLQTVGRGISNKMAVICVICSVLSMSAVFVWNGLRQRMSESR
jgi:hypothetical protein